MSSFKLGSTANLLSSTSMLLESEGGRLLRRFTWGMGTRSRIEVEGCWPSRASMTSEEGVDHMFVGVEVGQFGSSLKAKGSQVKRPLSTTLQICHTRKSTYIHYIHYSLLQNKLAITFLQQRLPAAVSLTLLLSISSSPPCLQPASCNQEQNQDLLRRVQDPLLESPPTNEMALLCSMY